MTGALDMATKDTNSFAYRLRELRKQRNLSQTELGHLTNLHYTHIGRFERGLAKPNGTSLIKLSDVLGVSSDYLMEGSTDQAAKAKFQDRELLKQFQEVERLPDEDKNVIKTLLDAFLTKRHLKALIG
jgi:transcriptional regulator with XRE-family HTH domain